MRAASMAFKIENIEEDELPDSAKARPLKVLKEEHNIICVGGMRNPAKSVKRLTQLRIVGEKISQMWNEFVESHPRALEVAANYGKSDNLFEEELLELWQKALKENLTKVEERPTAVKENWSSPPLSERTCGRRGEKKQRILMGASLT